jgi:hypothetical protein
METKEVFAQAGLFCLHRANAAEGNPILVLLSDIVGVSKVNGRCDVFLANGLIVEAAESFTQVADAWAKWLTTGM